MDKEARRTKIIELKNQGFSYKNIGKIFKLSSERIYQIKRNGGSNHYRRAILTRDFFTCQMCGLKDDNDGNQLIVHHFDEEPTNNDWTNLFTLCRSCHTLIHSSSEFNGKEKKNYLTKDCLECGKKTKNKFCSIECRKKHLYYEICCDFCGTKKIIPTRFRNKKNHFCNRNCRSKWQKDTHYNAKFFTRDKLSTEN
jgi:hypothetical protein